MKKSPITKKTSRNNSKSFNQKSKQGKNTLSQKELWELQTAWEETKKRLKKSKNEQDRMIVKFLECNHIHPETGLITNKSEWNSSYVSCGSEELKNKEWKT